jgi:hypothetical protein
MPLFFRLSAALAACLLPAACMTEPYDTPPGTYTVEVAIPTFTSDYGQDDMAVSAVQDFPVITGERIYFHVSLPISMNVFVFDKFGPPPGLPLLFAKQGISVYGVVVSAGGKIRFVFSPTEPIGSGEIKITLAKAPFKMVPGL